MFEAESGEEGERRTQGKGKASETHKISPTMQRKSPLLIIGDFLVPLGILCATTDTLWFENKYVKWGCQNYGPCTISDKSPFTFRECCYNCKWILPVQPFNLHLTIHEDVKLITGTIVMLDFQTIQLQFRIKLPL